MDSWNNAKAYTVSAVVLLVSYISLRYVWRRTLINRRIKKEKGRCQDEFAMMKDKLKIKQISARNRSTILNLPFIKLQHMLKDKDLLAEDVMRIYMQKALEEHAKLNCITEPIMDAIEKAIECDNYRAKKKNIHEDLPLLGIPVSLKENYYIKGLSSTGGMSSLLNKPAEEDGVLVKVLKHLGAIPFVRTNVPQSMMTCTGYGTEVQKGMGNCCTENCNEHRFECSNPMYGVTVNYHNHKKGPGGSSGGEAAMLASGASILGWGTDIGGSLRIPAHCSGIFSLKPTSGRLSLKSSEEISCGQNVISPSCGPMARDVDTLVMAMKAILCDYHFKQDPSVPPLPFNSKLYESKNFLRIGYYSYDGYLRCIPGVERGLQLAKETLEKGGHTLIPFHVPDAQKMFAKYCVKAFFGDGGANFLKYWNDDQIDGSIYHLVKLFQLPNVLITLISYIVDFVTKDNVVGETLRSMQGAGSVKDWWQLAVDIAAYKKEFLSLWQDKNLDAMICPTMPFVAPPIGTVKYLLGGAVYASLYNLLNYPAGCVPVTKVTAIDQAKMCDYPCNTMTEKFIKKYFSADTSGLPVSVQCVALPFQEELVLRVMKELDVTLKLI